MKKMLHITVTDAETGEVMRQNGLPVEFNSDMVFLAARVSKNEKSSGFALYCAMPSGARDDPDGRMIEAIFDGLKKIFANLPQNAKLKSACMASAIVGLKDLLEAELGAEGAAAAMEFAVGKLRGDAP